MKTFQKTQSFINISMKIYIKHFEKKLKSFITTCMVLYAKLFKEIHEFLKHLYANYTVNFFKKKKPKVS